MDNLARVIDQGAMSHEAGTVVAVARRSLRVHTRSGSYDARRAASCLLEPRKGDSVTLALIEGGGSYVVAVLERDEAGGPARLRVEGDLEIAPEGRLRMASAEGIDLVTAAAVTLTSASVALKSIDVHATFERATALGKLLHLQLEHVRSVSVTVDRVAERVAETVERCYRYVGGADVVRAERLDYQATEMARVHSNNVVVTAEKLVKVDGGQIHMG